MAALTHLQIRQMLDAALAYADEHALAVAVSIVDSGAHLCGFQRSDKVSLGPIDVSQKKARTAVLFRCNSREFGSLIASEGLSGMEHTNGGLAAFGGGLPIVLNGEVAGGIGVSGATAEQDEAIARYAIQSL